MFFDVLDRLGLIELIKKLKIVFSSKISKKSGSYYDDNALSNAYHALVQKRIGETRSFL